MPEPLPNNSPNSAPLHSHSKAVDPSQYGPSQHFSGSTPDMSIFPPDLTKRIEEFRAHVKGASSPLI
ncbi:MAG: hypothetical protein WBM07_18785, partial [Chitinivibrionales bacterium]